MAGAQRPVHDHGFGSRDKSAPSAINAICQPSMPSTATTGAVAARARAADGPAPLGGLHPGERGRDSGGQGQQAAGGLRQAAVGARQPCATPAADGLGADELGCAVRAIPCEAR